jgi:hypothetical protein
MNHIKLLKAQANLALTMIEKRARPGIDNYIAELERQAGILARTWIVIRAAGMEVVLKSGDPKEIDTVAKSIMTLQGEKPKP